MHGRPAGRHQRLREISPSTYDSVNRFEPTTVSALSGAAMRRAAADDQGADEERL